MPRPGRETPAYLGIVPCAPAMKGVSTQYRKFPCLCNIERSPFSAWVHFAANGARREADRERWTVRGHLLRGNIFSRAIRCAGTCRAIVGRSEQSIVGSSGQGSSDRAAGAAVIGGATLAHSRRTERPFRHLIGDQGAPSLLLGRSSSARSTRASCAAVFDMIPASLSSCYAGRGGKTKTEGLQYLEPKGNVLLGSPGEHLTLRRQLLPVTLRRRARGCYRSADLPVQAPCFRHLRRWPGSRTGLSTAFRTYDRHAAIPAGLSLRPGEPPPARSSA